MLHPVFRKGPQLVEGVLVVHHDSDDHAVRHAFRSDITRVDTADKTVAVSRFIEQPLCHLITEKKLLVR